MRHFSCAWISAADLSPPTCSPRRKLVAAVVVTQVWIYRVDRDDRRSHGGSRRFDCDSKLLERVNSLTSVSLLQAHYPVMFGSVKMKLYFKADLKIPTVVKLTTPPKKKKNYSASLLLFSFISRYLLQPF